MCRSLTDNDTMVEKELSERNECQVRKPNQSEEGTQQFHGFEDRQYQRL